MTKVAELIAAAAELNTMELKELRMGIQRLEQRRPGELIDRDGFSIGLTRLDDGAYLKLRRRSIAIEDDDMFLIRLLYPSFPWAEESEESRWLNLAKVHFVLEHLYGESSLLYDDYKGSFSFPFVLDVIKGDNMFAYLLNIRDHRGTLEFALRKCVSGEGKVDTHIHPPFESEFSRKEINVFVAYYCGRLEGRFNALTALRIQPMPFVQRVESNLILYGYCDEQFFEKQYNRSEDFEEAYRRLEAKVHPEAQPNVES